MATNQAPYLTRFPNLTEGLTVYSNDGEKLGKITSLMDDYFIVQKGLFFPKDFTLRYEEIQNVKDDSVYLSIPQTDLSSWRDESYPGWQQADDINMGRMDAQPMDEYKDRYQGRFTQEIKVPVAEEELNAQKTTRQVGEVQLRKIVHTELRHFTIPVTREEVRVERLPVSEIEGSISSSGADMSFEEKTIRVPVMEEEVTITKRPVVKEEVRVSKETMTEQREIQGEVRKEEVRIEGEDMLKKKAS